MLAMHAGHMSAPLLFRFPFFRWPVLIFEILGQSIERPLPELAILLHPLSRLPKRSGVEPHFVNPPISPPPKQTGLFQYAQMFRDGGERHGVRLRQVRHTFITAREMSQDTPPGGIGQRSESTIQCSRRIFNHLVKQCSRPFPMQIKKQPSLQQGYGWDGLRDRFIKRMVPTKETKGVPISEIFASFWAN